MCAQKQRCGTRGELLQTVKSLLQRKAKRWYRISLPTVSFDCIPFRGVIGLIFMTTPISRR